MSRARPVSLALAFALGGCDIVLGFHELPTADLAPGCSGMNLLHTFGAGTLDPIWQTTYLNAAATIDVTPDTLTITSPPTVTGSVVASTASFDLRGDSIAVGVSPGDPNMEVSLALLSPIPQHSLGMFINGGTLHFTSSQDASGQVEVASIVYDPVAHRYWRIAQAGSETRWETSPDSKTWTTRTTAQYAWPDFFNVQLGMSPNVAPTVTFDRLNAGRPPGVVCRAIVLSDEFDGDALADIWYPSIVNGSVAATGGQLTLMLGGGGTSEVFVPAVDVYDLRASQFIVHVAQLPDSTTDANVGFGIAMLAMLPAAQAQLYASGTSLRTLATGQGTLGTVPLDPSTSSWWRLRGAGDVLYTETSSDGIHYNEVAEVPGLALDRVQPFFAITGTQANSVAFDHFNVPP
jgi:hypothetical protein